MKCGGLPILLGVGDMGFLSRDEMERLGFASLGQNVVLSDKASFYNCAAISIGSHVRIDDFCALSAGAGGIRIGSYIHIAIGCSLIGAGAILIEDFSTLSSRVAIYSSSDDYSGRSLTNPLLPAEYKRVHEAPVHLGRHVVVGSGSVILPGVDIQEGCAIGALSLIKNDCPAFGIYAGSPARRIKERAADLLELEKKFLAGQ